MVKKKIELEKKEILKEGKEIDFETFIEATEEVIDEISEQEKIKVSILGNEFLRLVQGNKFIQVKTRMTYGDKLKVKNASKPASYLYDEDSGDIEVKLKEENIDLFLLEKQVIEADFGQVNRETIKENEDHDKLFESALEIIKLKNGLVQTKKQLEKNKMKKKA